MSLSERETALARARAREKTRLEQREADLRELMALPAGQRFFYDLFDRVTGVYSGSFVVEETETTRGDGKPLVTAFNEGRRSIGIEMSNTLQRLAPESFTKMMLEAIRTQNYDAATVASERVPSTGDSSRP